MATGAPSVSQREVRENDDEANPRGGDGRRRPHDALGGIRRPLVRGEFVHDLCTMNTTPRSIAFSLNRANPDAIPVVVDRSRFFDSEFVL